MVVGMGAVAFCRGSDCAVAVCCDNGGVAFCRDNGDERKDDNVEELHGKDML